MVTNNPQSSKPFVTSRGSWQLFAALGDPIRQAIVRELQSGPLSAGRIAAGFRVTRPAISRHLRVLREAGWVVERRSGRNRVYRLSPPALGAALEWLQALARQGATRGERPAAPPAGGRPREAWAPWSD